MCCGKNVTLKPRKMSQKLDLPEPLVEHPPEDLRPPVVEPGEDAEDRAAEEHVVEVRDDEVGVLHLPVDRERGEEDPGEAADREDGDEAEREEHRRVEVESCRATVVASQLKIFTPVGTRDHHRAIMKNAFRTPAAARP